jgi:hypothetical protein
MWARVLIRGHRPGVVHYHQSGYLFRVSESDIARGGAKFIASPYVLQNFYFSFLTLSLDPTSFDPLARENLPLGEGAASK